MSETLSAEDRAAIDLMRAADADLDAAADPAPAAVPPAPDAPPAATDAAPEADVAAAPEQRHVPKAALDAERNRRKATEAELHKFREETAARQAALTERFNMLAQAAQAAQAPAAATVAPAAEVPLPDLNADPVGHILALHESVRAELQAVKARQEQGEQLSQQTAQAQQMAQQMAQLRQWGAAQETEFQNREANYSQAAQFLRNTRDAQLQALGVANPAERAAIISNDVTQIAARARVDGANFAERIYALARSSGFAEPAPAGTAPAAPAAPAAPVAAVADPIATIERGRDMARGLGSVGAAPAPRMTPERIAEMSEAQFGAMLAKIKGDPAAMRELFGA